MCCAKIDYTFRGDKLGFYACADKNSIESTDGNIYDNAGFNGNWYCANAVTASVALVLTSSLAVLNLI